jgi:hypothetical protein
VSALLELMAANGNVTCRCITGFHNASEFLAVISPSLATLPVMCTSLYISSTRKVPLHIFSQVAVLLCDSC